MTPTCIGRVRSFDRSKSLAAVTGLLVCGLEYDEETGDNGFTHIHFWIDEYEPIVRLEEALRCLSSYRKVSSWSYDFLPTTIH